MADIAESSSAACKDDKPVIVRVKRKAYQSALEAFWLEINERPLKRPLLDFEKLSLSDSSEKVEEARTKKVFVQRVETVSSSEVTVDILQSFVPNSVDAFGSEGKTEERKRTFKTTNSKHDQLLDKAKQNQEILSKNARFEQIWRSRKGKKEARNGALHEMCHFYDIVRVDVEERSDEVQEQEDADLEDHRIMLSFLPLLREFIPSAAAEIEADIHDMSKRASKDDYVYDLYAVKNDINVTEEDATHPFPLVQVDDDDGFYHDLAESDYESDDSNAENNPLNDYPDEETSEEGVECKASDDDSEELESASPSEKCSASENLEDYYHSEGVDPLYEDDILEDDNEFHNYDNDGDDDEGRWSYR